MRRAEEERRHKIATLKRKKRKRKKIGIVPENCCILQTWLGRQLVCMSCLVMASCRLAVKFELKNSVLLKVPSKCLRVTLWSKKQVAFGSSFAIKVKSKLLTTLHVGWLLCCDSSSRDSTSQPIDSLRRSLHSHILVLFRKRDLHSIRNNHIFILIPLFGYKQLVLFLRFLHLCEYKQVRNVSVLFSECFFQSIFPSGNG